MAESPAERTRRLPAAVRPEDAQPPDPARPDPAEPDPAEPTLPSVPAARRAPADATQRIPQADATQRFPASHTEMIPETHPDRPTRAMRQVRRRADDGAWPAIPMLPVIKPDTEPMSEIDRVREQRGVRALREHMDQWRDDDADAPAWPEREDPPGTMYPPRG